MNIIVRGKPGATTGTLTFEGETVPCALGRSGIVPKDTKKEGDGATPQGSWPLRHVLYRPDRLDAPEGNLPAKAISPSDGWCDEPTDPHYNKAVDLPFSASAEKMWRDDELYNVCVVLGHNDNPVIPHKGSAIFFHVAKQDGENLKPTEGCIALPQDILLRVLKSCSSAARMEIELEEHN